MKIGVKIAIALAVLVVVAVAVYAYLQSQKRKKAEQAADDADKVRDAQIDAFVLSSMPAEILAPNTPGVPQEGVNPNVKADRENAVPIDSAAGRAMVETWTRIYGTQPSTLRQIKGRVFNIDRIFSGLTESQAANFKQRLAARVNTYSLGQPETFPVVTRFENPALGQALEVLSTSNLWPLPNAGKISLSEQFAPLVKIQPLNYSVYAPDGNPNNTSGDRFSIWNGNGAGASTAARAFVTNWLTEIRLIEQAVQDYAILALVESGQIKY